MATFKVGQRVRKIAYADRHDWRLVAHVGSRGEVIGMQFDQGVCCAYSYMLAPLTPPAQDNRASEFVADMERFASVAKPKVRVLTPSELDRVHGGGR